MDKLEIPARAPITEVVAGNYKWVIVLVAWAAQVCTFVDRLAWGTVGLSASQSIGLPLAALGIFVTAFFTGYVGSNLLSGILTDKVGARRIITGSMFMLGLLTFGFGLNKNIAIGMVLQALMGLTAGADTNAAMKLLAAWFGPRDRGKAIGLWMTCTPCAVMIANAIIPILLVGHGWQAVYKILGTVTIGFGALSFLLLRDGPRSDTARYVARRLNFKPLMRNRQFLLLATVGFGGYWAVWGFTFLVNALMVKHYGLSPVAAGAIVAWFGAASLPSKPIMGFLSDHFGTRKPFMLGNMIAFAALITAFPFLTDERALVIGAAAVGFFALAWSPLALATIVEAGGKSMVASVSGFANGLWQLSSLIAPSGAWLIYETTHILYAPFLFLAAGPIAAAVALIWVKDSADLGAGSGH